MIGINGLTYDRDDYYSRPPYEFRRNIWGISRGSYNSESSDLPIIQDRIVTMNDSIIIPDYANHYHQLRFDGSFDGYFEGYEEFEMQTATTPSDQTLIVAGEPKRFPISLFGDTYYSYIPLESTTVFVNDEKYTFIGNDELAASGELATHEHLLRERRSPYSPLVPYDFQGTFINPLHGNYFSITEIKRSSYRKVYQANPGEPIKKLIVTESPDKPYAPWSQVENGIYYQLEQEGFMLYSLVQYNIVIDEPKSAVTSSVWRSYD